MGCPHGYYLPTGGPAWLRQSSLVLNGHRQHFYTETKNLTEAHDVLNLRQSGVPGGEESALTLGHSAEYALVSLFLAVGGAILPS